MALLVLMPSIANNVFFNGNTGYDVTHGKNAFHEVVLVPVTKKALFFLKNVI